MGELLLPVAAWRAATDARRRALFVAITGILFGSVVASASRAGFLLVTAELLAVMALAGACLRLGLGLPLRRRRC